MGIYKPHLALTSSDREVLVLLGQLVLATEGQASTNFPSDAVALSPAEATRLLGLLEEFVSSKLFVEGSYFAEGIANNADAQDHRLREIYLSWRSRRGHSRISSGYVWAEFLHRAGFNGGHEGWYVNGAARNSPVRPMSLELFVSMERKLLETAKLHPRVSELIMELVERALPELHSLQAHKRKVEEGSIRRFVNNAIREVSEHISGREKEPMSRKNYSFVDHNSRHVCTIYYARLDRCGSDLRYCCCSSRCVWKIEITVSGNYSNRCNNPQIPSL
jgi:hypothetical protein